MILLAALRLRVLHVWTFYYKRHKITIEENIKGKEILIAIVSMLVGLIKSTSDRLYEADSEYSV